MNHPSCLQKSVSMTPFRRRRISSYSPQQSSLSKECPLFQKRITEAYVEYCAIDSGFMNLAKQFISTSGSVSTFVTANELLPCPSAHCIFF